MRHLIAFLAVLALLAAGYFLLQPSVVSVRGCVFLRSLDGREIPGAGAKAAWYPRKVVDSALVAWSRRVEEARSENRLELQAARSTWNRAVARREEAGRLLRAAEQARSADLEISRARYREAVADAEDALRRMEQMASGLEETADPARFVESLPTPSGQVVAGRNGCFSAEVPGDQDICLVVTMSVPGKESEVSVWLRRGTFADGEEVVFSNASLLTSESLAEFARQTKKPESPKGSPAE